MHRHLHDVFGLQQTLPELAATVAFGIALPVALATRFPDLLTSVPSWRSALALILVLDIAAGCVANFTRSTNDFYAARPRNRWIFIAIHIHAIIVALLLSTDFAASLPVWSYTIAGAVVVNVLKSNPLQTFAGGFLLAAGLSWLALSPGLSPFMSIVFALFMLKVLFSFAVDHYPCAQSGCAPEGRA
jgi:hypothetical protein